MRLSISSPRNWKKIEEEDPEGARLTKHWLAVQLDLAVIHGKIETASSLLLGLDTYFAALCLARKIPYKAIISCRNQDKFWNEESKNHFDFFLGAAKKIEYVSTDPYTEGYIPKQMNTIADWVAEENGKLLVIKRERLSKIQKEMINRLGENPNIAIYEVRRPWER